MDYTVKLHKDVAEAIEKLPKQTNAEIKRLLDTLCTGGLSQVPDAAIRIVLSDEFMLYATQKKSASGKYNAAILTGHCCPNAMNEFYFSELKEFREGKSIAAGEQPTFHHFQTIKQKEAVEKEQFQYIPYEPQGDSPTNQKTSLDTIFPLKG
ncbi:MAG: hypothetical protein RQ899_12960 [Pseudomonadales bacterium]|nr:hypothetical protein [Pseudomonadales bacterium]